MDVRALRKLARHPVQFFLEESLKLRFPWKEESAEFLLSPLEKYKVRQAALHQDVGDIVGQMEREGRLPAGVFREMAVMEVEEAGAVKYGEVFTLELTPHAKEFKFVTEGYAVAPPVLEAQGVIENVTKKGLVFFGDDLLQIWPVYLVVKQVLGSAEVFLAKKGKEAEIPECDAEDALRRYVEYYKRSMEAPSPFFPAWARKILKGDVPARGEDEMVEWAEKRNILPQQKEWIDEWKPYLREVFREFV